MRWLTKWVVAGSCGMILVCPISAQEKSVSPGINKPFLAPSVTEFQGKFEKEGREAFDNREAIVKECKLKPGMVVADVGAGTGLFTRLFAAEVGESGKVFAVDIAKEFVEHVELSARQAKLKNVVGVVCKPDSVELVEASVDIVFLCDTYHHFEFPEKTMKSIHRALRPGGRVVLVDYRRILGKSTEWVLGHVRAGQEVVEKEITACGFRRTRDVEGLLKENYLVEFEKVDGM
ncbi:MAG: class I SAM-dependent methyltransferase [Planctomycetaceae bacterium]